METELPSNKDLQTHLSEEQTRLIFAKKSSYYFFRNLLEL